MMIPTLRTQVALATALRSRLGNSGAVRARAVTGLLGARATRIQAGRGWGARAGAAQLARCRGRGLAGWSPPPRLGLDRTRSADGAGNGSLSNASRAARTADPTASPRRVLSRPMTRSLPSRRVVRSQGRPRGSRRPSAGAKAVWLGRRGHNVGPESPVRLTGRAVVPRHDRGHAWSLSLGARRRRSL